MHHHVDPQFTIRPDGKYTAYHTGHDVFLTVQDTLVDLLTWYACWLHRRHRCRTGRSLDPNRVIAKLLYIHPYILSRCTKTSDRGNALRYMHWCDHYVRQHGQLPIEYWRPYKLGMKTYDLDPRPGL